LEFVAGDDALAIPEQASQHPGGLQLQSDNHLPLPQDQLHVIKLEQPEVISHQLSARDYSRIPHDTSVVESACLAAECS